MLFLPHALTSAAFAQDISEVAIERHSVDDHYRITALVMGDPGAEVASVDAMFTFMNGPQPLEDVVTLSFSHEENGGRLFVYDQLQFEDLAVDASYDVLFDLRDSVGGSLGAMETPIVVGDTVGTVYTDLAGDIVVGPDEVATITGTVTGNVFAEGQLTVTGIVDGELDVGEGGEVLLDNASVTTLKTNQELSFMSVLAYGTLLESVTLTGGGEIDLVDSEVGDLSIEGADDVTLDGVTGTADVGVSAGDIDVSDLSGGIITLDAEDDLSVTGDVTSGDDLWLRGGKVEQTVGSLHSLGNMWVHSRGPLTFRADVDVNGTTGLRGKNVRLLGPQMNSGPMFVSTPWYGKTVIDTEMTWANGACSTIVDEERTGGVYVFDDRGYAAKTNPPPRYHSPEVKPKVDYWLCL